MEGSTVVFVTTPLQCIPVVMVALGLNYIASRIDISVDSRQIVPP